MQGIPREGTAKVSGVMSTFEPGQPGVQRQAVEEAARYEETLRTMGARPPGTSYDVSGIKPQLILSPEAEKFVRGVEEMLRKDKGDTYQKLVDKLKAESEQVQMRTGIEDYRLSQQIRREKFTPEELGVYEQILKKPSFQWTAEDKIFVNDFLSESKRRVILPEEKPIILNTPEPVDDVLLRAAKEGVAEHIGEKSKIDLITDSYTKSKVKMPRKPKKKKEAPAKTSADVVKIPDVLKTGAQLKAEADRYGVVFDGMTGEKGRVQLAKYVDPETKRSFIKHPDETLEQAITRSRKSAGVDTPVKYDEAAISRYPALEIDGKVYVADMPDGTTHSIIWDSLPTGAVKNAKKVVSGWADKNGSNFAKHHVGVLAGIEVDEDGTIHFNTGKAAIGMTAGFMIPTEGIPTAVKAFIQKHPGAKLTRNFGLFKQTGYWKGADGKWRHELDTSRLKIDHTKLASGKEYNIQEIVEHPNLFEVVPELKRYTVRIDPTLPDSDSGYLKLGARAFGFHPSIVGDDIATQYFLKSAMVHELQHGIGFETGVPSIGSSEELARAHILYKKLSEGLRALKKRTANKDDKSYLEELANAMEKESNRAYPNKKLFDDFSATSMPRILDFSDPFDVVNTIGSIPITQRAVRAAYFQHPGEMESRLVSLRMEMTQEERAMIPPWETLDQMLESEIATDVWKLPKGQTKPKGELLYGATGLGIGAQLMDVDEEELNPYYAGVGPIFGRLVKRFARKRTNKIYNHPGGEVEKMYEQSREAVEKQEKKKWDDIKTELSTQFTDVGAAAKKMAKKIDPELGRELEEYKNALGGVNSRATLQLKDAVKKIWKPLSEEESDILDMYIDALRNIEISGYRPDIIHQKGIKVEQFKEFVDNLQKNKGLTNDQMAKIKLSASEFFSAMQFQLKQYREAGVISQKSYDNMSKYIYSPRHYLEYMSRLDRGVSGRAISIKDSGIKELKSGAEGLRDIRAKRLLHYTIITTQDTIAKARANGKLLELADLIAERNQELVAQGGKAERALVRRASIIGETADGRPKFEKPDRGEKTISTVVDDKPVEMIVPTEFADAWLRSDPELSRATAQTLRWFSGTQMVKPVATGMNPGFVLTNVPMDIGTVLTGKQYSMFLPSALNQLRTDIKAVWSDAVHKTGRYRDYIDEYGGMEFLSLYGRLGKEGGTLEAAEEIAGWPGLFSEVLIRLAHRERGIINGKKAFMKKFGREPNPQEIKEIQFKASQYARDHGPDYSQGGSLTKVIDSVIPYSNAYVQANRVVINNILENKTRFTIMASQMMTGIGALYAYNRAANPEALSQVSPQERAQNFVMVLPEIDGITTYKDSEGNKRYRYVKIKKVPELAPIAMAFESIIEYMDTGKVPKRELFASLEGVFPPHFIPTLSALVAVAGNKDTYFWNDIWKGPENIPNSLKYYPGETQEAFVKLGAVLNISPEQLAAGFHAVIPKSNSIVTGGVNAVSAVVSLLDPPAINAVGKSFNETLSKDPTFKRIMGTTHPKNAEKFQEAYEVIEETKGEHAVQWMTLNEHIRRFMVSQTRDNLMEVGKYIFSQPRQDWNRLDRQFKAAIEMKDVPEASYWITVKRAPVSARARILYQRVASLPPEERMKFIGLANAIPGVVTKEVMKEWTRLMAEDGHISNKE